MDIKAFFEVKEKALASCIRPVERSQSGWLVEGDPALQWLGMLTWIPAQS